MQHAGKYILLVLFGLFVGYFIFSKDPEYISTIVTETKTDTVYITVRDTVRITRNEIRHEVLRDTILIDPIQPQIKAFKSSKSFTYGYATVSGEVLGEVLKMDITTDFNIPVITNTITNTVTITKKPQGLFLTAGVDKQLSPNVGAVYVRDRVLVGISTSDFKFGYKLK